MRKFLAVLKAKTSVSIIRLFKVGGGSTFPGLLAEKIDPQIITKLSSKLKYGSIIITGTNGKTTTSKMISDILTKAGYEVVSNRAGSNMTRGVASSLIEKSSWMGTKIDGDIGVFEIDEATMAYAVKKIKPKAILVTNLFRDQLDRYGELDKTAKIIKDSFSDANKTQIILNADDPLVASMGQDVNASYYGLDDSNIVATSEAAMDSKDCLRCGAELVFKQRYFGHSGIYSCPNCGFARPKPKNIAFNISLSPEATFMQLRLHSDAIGVSINLPGLFNVYNVLAAASLTHWLGVDKKIISESINAFQAAFGRMEKITIGKKHMLILLVKNPTGFNQVLRSITSDDTKKTVAILLNDNFADGTDVSWIWDSELELLKNRTGRIFVGGIRAQDMALRLKYAGLNMSFVKIIKEEEKVIDESLDSLPDGQTLYVMPTYTAMLKIRNMLTSQGLVKGFWEGQ
ncbi:MAG: Mur ligase family protein [Actinobacteria bacterium]|nr:MAG: Mur ligase family protein [Actinomycetota bacterium]